MTNLWHFWILRLHLNLLHCHLDSRLTMGQTEHLGGIQGKDTCALFTEMGSRLTNKISRNVKQFFWKEGSDGWMVGLLVGWMDGRITGLKNKHKENRVFYRIFRNFRHAFWLVLLSWMNTFVFEHVSLKFYSCLIASQKFQVLTYVSRKPSEYRCGTKVKPCRSGG